MTNAPEGGTASDNRLSFLQNAAAKYAGRSGDFRHESRSCKWHSVVSVHKIITRSDILRHTEKGISIKDNKTN